MRQQMLKLKVKLIRKNNGINDATGIYLYKINSERFKEEPTSQNNTDIDRSSAWCAIQFTYGNVPYG